MRMFFVIGKQFLPYIIKTETLYTVLMNAIFNATFTSLVFIYMKQSKGARDGP
jgi:hypothetical protein